MKTFLITQDLFASTAERLAFAKPVEAETKEAAIEKYLAQFEDMKMSDDHASRMAYTVLKRSLVVLPSGSEN